MVNKFIFVRVIYLCYDALLIAYRIVTLNC